MRTLKCIMLVDDNRDDNFYHERVIRKCKAAEVVVAKQSGASALAYLQAEPGADTLRPSLIFLDINMPAMNGWEFLDAYQRLPPGSQSGVIIVVLSTSENPDDLAKARARNVEFTTKPLTAAALEAIMERHPRL